METQHLEKWKVNLRALYKMESAYVMAIASALGETWLLMTDAQRTAVLTHLWVPVWLIPPVLLIAGIAARTRPSKAITPAEAAAKSNDAPQPSTDKDTP